MSLTSLLRSFTSLLISPTSATVSPDALAPSKSLPATKSIPSFHHCSEVLKTIEEYNLSRPDAIVHYGQIILQHYRKSMAFIDLYNLYEKVTLAAIEIGNESVSNAAIDILTRKFGPHSARLAYLRAYRMESHGEYEKATEIYENLIKKESTPTPQQIQVQMNAYKRLAMIAMSRRKIDECVRILTSYTRNFGGDENGWLMLSSAYFTIQSVDLALFAMEECILIVPENYLYSLRLAELLYTEERYDEARMYFAQSVELKPSSNARALFGLLLCCRASKSSTSSSSSSRTNSHADLINWTIRKIHVLYSAQAPMWLPILKESLQISNV